MLSQILVNRVNYGYEGLAPVEVTHLNGERVKSLRHLARLLRACADDYLRFTLDDGQGSVFVLDRAEAEAANAEILDHYKIPAASSDTGE